MLLPSNNVQENLAKAAAKIALHNFHWNHATLVLFNSTLLYSVDIFLRIYPKSVIVGHGLFYPKFVKKTTQYVLFGSDLSDITNMIIWMQRHQFDNTGSYIVVCQAELPQDCDEEDAVNIFWKYKILNIVYVNEETERNKLNGYTYFHPNDCQNARPSKLQNWEACVINNFKCRNMYPQKLKNLHGCPIIVSTFNQVPYMNITSGTPTGADGDLLCVIAQAMNLTLNIMTPRIGNGWGKVEENGTWSGSLADVFYDWANFSMTSACITLSRFTTFQMSIDYAVVTVGWVTHPSEIEPPSLKLLRPFQANVRIALCVSFVMVIVFTMFVKSNFMSSIRKVLNVIIPDGIIFYSWLLCMGLPVNSFPKNKALLCLTLVWIWYCFLVRTIYQVCLINSLQTDVYSPEFNTIEEAIASKYPFGGGMALRDYYIENSLVYDDWLNVESDDIYPTMVKMSQGFKFVLAMNLETTTIFLNRKSNRNLHVLPQVIVRSPTVLFFKKYSPLARSLDDVLTRLRESGVIQKIYLNNTDKSVLQKTSDNYIPITIEHYTGCYAIILAGWMLSALCFIIEILMPRNVTPIN